MRLIFFFFCLLAPVVLLAQQDTTCRDFVYLKNGSVYRGVITEVQDNGQVMLKSWNGLNFHFPEKSIRKIVQQCTDTQKRTPRTYSYPETGWYHHTRLGVLNGQGIDGYFKSGVMLQHSSGYAFNRLLAVGLGAGAENFAPGEYEPGNYPIFAEVKGYLLPKRITPFYSLGMGWAFSGNGNESRWRFEDDWQGGWMAQGQVGYRIGNHFTLQTGIRLQKSRRVWSNFIDNSRGTDHILFKRLEISLGILL